MNRLLKPPTGFRKLPPKDNVLNDLALSDVDLQVNHCNRQTSSRSWIQQVQKLPAPVSSIGADLAVLHPLLVFCLGFAFVWGTSQIVLPTEQP